MINGLIPSSYLLEITGKPIKSIISESFGITKINVNSGMFTNDLDARSALMKSIKFLSPNSTQPVESFNPIFFPSKDPISVSFDDDEIDIQSAVSDLQNNEDGKIYVPISKKFDAVGDFVILRQVKKSSSYSIIGKVIASPAWYAADIIENSLSQTVKEQVTLN